MVVVPCLMRVSFSSAGKEENHYYQFCIWRGDGHSSALLYGSHSAGAHIISVNIPCKFLLRVSLYKCQDPVYPMCGSSSVIELAEKMV